MDFAELEKDTASRDEWLLMCRKQIVFSQMILIKDDIHYGQINSDFRQTTFFPFAVFFVLEKELGTSFSHNIDDECKKLIHRITPPRYMQIKIITCVNIELPGNQQLISLPRRW
ncbi:unnamed protein product [Malus baccata var. baccata]